MRALPLPALVATLVAVAVASACGDSEENTGDARAQGSGGNAGASGSAGLGNSGGSTGTAGSGGATAGSSGSAGGTSPDAGDGPSTDSDAADPDADPDTSTDAEPDGDAVPDAVSQFCGDGIRDPLTEECDDGPGSEADSCNDRCRVTEVVPAPLPPPNGLPNGARTLGLGRHPVAAGPQGYAVVLLDVRDSPAILLFSTLDSQGKALIQGVDFGASTTTRPYEDSAPVIAALPDGSYAAAWTDLLVDKDQRGIALRRISPSTTAPAAATLGTPRAANTTTNFNQENPDLVWTGSQLVAAWIQQGISPSYDVVVRAFSSSLAALGPEQIVANTDKNELHVALTPFAGSYAIAWRTSNAFDDETLHVRAGSTAWTVGPHRPSNSFDRPAIVAIDDTRLLVVFAADSALPTDREQARLYAAVLDTTAPGVTAAFDFEHPVPIEGITTTQTQPVVARAGARLYVAWRETDWPPNDQGDNLWLKDIPWTHSATDGAITLELSRAALPLPPDAARRQASQAIPALAASPNGSKLLIAYNDRSQQQTSPEVLVRLSPAPVLWPSGFGE